MSHPISSWRSASGVAIVAAVALAIGCASGGASGASGNAPPGSRRDGSGDRSGAATAAAFQPPISTATIILEHAPDLGITDAQRNAIVVIRRELDSVNAPLRTRLDSLRPSQRPANPRDMSPEQREEIRARLAAVGTVVSQLRDNNLTARPRLMALLTADQQQQVAQLEEDARKKAEEAASDTRRGDEGGAGGRRRGGRGGGGGGRPPER